MSQTRVFVSSTCYDLIQIRQNLNSHIQSLGHVPVMSEFISFHVDPQENTLENCRRNVRENADIFLLVIGSKTGSLDSASGKSLVNLEYDAAVEEGIEIYVFVDQSILALLPIWRKNKAADFTPGVDSNYVLEFVQRIRDEQRWTFPFRTEADIHEIFATQLSNHLQDLLVQNRLGALRIADAFRTESEEVVRILRSKEQCWEYLLTAALLEPRLKRYARDIEDIRMGRVLGSHRSHKGEAYMNWVTNKFPELKCTLEKLISLFQGDIMRAWGPLGIPGDPTAMLEAVREVELTLTAIIAIESDIFRTCGPDAAGPVRKALLGMTDDLVRPIEAVPGQIRNFVEQVRRHDASQGTLLLNLNLTFTFTKGETFNNALKEMHRIMPAHDWF